MVLKTTKALVHSAVVSPAPRHPMPVVEQAIVDMLAGYICKAEDKGSDDIWEEFRGIRQMR
jgi:hypothetical protein